MRNVSVLQGECRVSSDPNVVLTTVLGSCVAVCLHDARSGIGGMNHFLLPGGSSGSQRDMRYGVHSMELLINQILKLGGNRRDLTAKLYGGAQVIKNRANIGRSNSEFALSFLQREGIAIAGKDLGGRSARRLKFHAARGEVNNMIVPATPDIEPLAPRRHAAAASEKPDITLF